MKEKNKQEIYKIIIAIIISVSITFTVTIYGYYHYLEKNGALLNSYKESEEISKELDVLKTYIDKYYKGEINEEDLKNAALKGYVEGLGDEYTTFLTSEEWEELSSSLSNYTGIGIYMAQLKSTGEAVILSTIGEESPAEKAGLEAGDIIVEVEGENIEGKELDYISSKVKGEEGTPVTIKVKRGEEYLDFTIVRESIKVYEIKSEMLENNIGYIDFDSFTETSYQEFKEAFENLKSQGAEKLIIDLRNNTGGYVEDALNIANMIVPKGETLLITEDKDGERTYEVAENDPVITNMPIVVLVNEYSASASEILTGILKDYNLATIVGTNTYGKGVIQSIINNVLGGALKVTTSEYFTPNGNKINGVGIEPDIVVEASEDEESQLEFEQEEDVQLQKAIEVLNEK